MYEFPFFFILADIWEFIRRGGSKRSKMSRVTPDEHIFDLSLKREHPSKLLDYIC